MDGWMDRWMDGWMNDTPVACFGALKIGFIIILWMDRWMRDR